MLARKQNITDNKQWLEARERSTEMFSKKDIQALEGEAISRIERVASKYQNVCIGWIAGKDSIPLEYIMRKTSVIYTPIMWRGINEYPAMRRWIEENKPDNLIEEVIDKYSLEWLEAHPYFLFCQNGTRQEWMATKWKRQRADLKKHGFDLFVTGRRLKDGNQCGSAAEDFLLHKPDYDTLSPIADWSAEQLFAYIRYNDIQLPPFYDWERGYLIGSIAMGEWTERAALGKPVNEVWDEIYNIDPDIVINAANTLTSARLYLKGARA